MTQEQIEKYSELMAKFEGWLQRPANSRHYWHGNLDMNINQMAYYTDYNWLHRVWEKFRDLKFEDDEYPDRYLFIVDQIRFKLTDDTLEEAFLELGKGLEWLQTLKK